MSETADEPRHVLLVEDEASILSALSLLLELEGYRVTEATDGRQALAVLARERPDVIITDFMMPFMNGEEMVRQIRSEARLRDIPIVLMSAVSPRDAGLVGVVDAYLRKPPDVEELFGLIARAVAGGREGLRQASPGSPVE